MRFKNVMTHIMYVWIRTHVLVGYEIFQIFHANMLYVLWCTINNSQWTTFPVYITLTCIKLLISLR